MKNASRWQFADQLDRQNQLVIDGWAIIRFSYDQVMDKPRHCQQITQQLIGKLLTKDLHPFPLSCMERDIIRLAMNKGDAITPTDVSKELVRSTKSARKILMELVQKKILSPASGNQRIRAYKLNERVKNPFLSP